MPRSRPRPETLRISLKPNSKVLSSRLESNYLGMQMYTRKHQGSHPRAFLSARPPQSFAGFGELPCRGITCHVHRLIDWLSGVLDVCSTQRISARSRHHSGASLACILTPAPFNTEKRPIPLDFLSPCGLFWAGQATSCRSSRPLLC